MIRLLQAPVVRNQRLGPDHFLLVVRAQEIALRVLPGQFVMAAPTTGSLPHPLLKRALAVYSVSQENGQPNLLHLLVKIVGEGTRALASLTCQERVDLIGPLGNGFDLPKAQGKIHLVIAGGVGIASVYLLVKTLHEVGEEVRLIYGGRSAVDLVGLEDFQKLDIPLVLTTEDGSLGLKGLVTEGLRKAMKTVPGAKLSLFVCGPHAMMQAIAEMALDAGPPCQAALEAHMACGFGVCLGCSVQTVDGYRLVCRDGPVFPAHELAWEEND